MNLLAIFFILASLFPVHPTRPAYTRTYAEVVSFLAADLTNTEPYTEDHNCVQFATELVNNARVNGFMAVGVGLYTDNDGHEIAAFYTSDRGIVYVESETDDVYYSIAVNQPLCSANGCWQDAVRSFYLEFNPTP